MSQERTLPPDRRGTTRPAGHPPESGSAALIPIGRGPAGYSSTGLGEWHGGGKS